MKKIFPLILLFISPHSTFAQNESLLLQFNSVQVENHVELNFTIRAGNTCNGIQIYRSADSINFTEIGDIQGICGSSDRNEMYGFIDNSPAKNKTNYYRLQLGTLGNSYIIKLFFIDLSGNKPLIFPNPVIDESTIFFLNNPHEELQLIIFSHDRRIVYESTPSRGSSFTLIRKDFTSGVYFFEIVKSKTILYKGKFVVE